MKLAITLAKRLPCKTLPTSVKVLRWVAMMKMESIHILKWTIVILDACNYLHLPQPPLTFCYSSKSPGKLIEKVLDVISTGTGMPQIVSAEAMMKRALYNWPESKAG